MLDANGMAAWRQALEPVLTDYFANPKHGDYARWQAALDQLPDVDKVSCALDNDQVTIGAANDLPDNEREQLESALKNFMPWRKGPFNLFGIHIDTEWRSDLKWQRVSRSIAPLQDKLVLDVGCGNGYYAWRMLGAGARHVIGIDPTLLFVMQCQVFKKYLPNAAIDILPLAIQSLPAPIAAFDSVFSMGVLYHRRDHLEHLQQLKQLLKPGGELVLETLVLDGEPGQVLFPAARYAKMNNVHAIPDVSVLTEWVTSAGLVNVRVVDVTPTTLAEQRRTDWMQFESLADFLDKNDRSKTIEGYPAPVRAILLANAPG